MNSTKVIEIPSHKIKELLTLSRLLWCKFTISDQTDFNETLRFIECERKIDSVSNINEIILEADISQKNLEILNQSLGKPVNVTFDVDGDEYYFESTLKDMFILLDQIPAISLEWPQKVFKKKLRQSERILSMLPDPLEENQLYVRDISVGGVAIFFKNGFQIQKDETYSGITLSIPTLSTESDHLSVHYNKIAVDLKPVRYSVFKDIYHLFGCKFQTFNPSNFFLIRKYLSIRKKEDQFFEENQSYPEKALPQILISPEPFAVPPISD